MPRIIMGLNKVFNADCKRELPGELLKLLMPDLNPRESE